MTQTPDEARAYQRARRRASIQVYFRDEAEKAEYARRAREDGHPRFSAWLLDRVREAAHGHVVDPQHVEGLRAEVARLRRWLAQKNEELAELRRDLKLAEAQRDDLRVVLAALGEVGPAVVERRIAPAARGR